MTAALALGGACAACCALPLGAGLSMFVVAGGAAYVGGAAGVAIAASAGALAWYSLRRRQVVTAEAAIACTLLADDFRERAAWIRGIAARHLRKSMRSPLTLYLVYGPEGADDVREMVRKEQECCAFLRFDLSVANDAVHLLITAPEAALEAADMLFNHFAPDLAPAEAA